MITERPLSSAPFPEPLVEASRELLREITGLLGNHPLSRPAVERVRQRYPQHVRQLEEAAGQIDVDPRDLTVATLSYDLFLALYGCSTVVLPTEQGPVAARNMDWMMPDRIARASCLVATDRGLHASFAGSIGVITGFSRAGFAVILNAVGSGNLDLDGYPVLLFLRHLLDEADSFADAVRRATHMRLASSALLTLVGTRNHQRVCIERSPTGHRQRWARGDQPLLVTNHYRRLAPPRFCHRYDYLSRHVPRLLSEPRPPCAEELLGLLCDANVKQDITAQHILICPATSTFRLFVPTALLEEIHAGNDLASMRKLL
jgi:isopenicillin-N N-acyltransferase-like protein